MTVRWSDTLPYCMWNVSESYNNLHVVEGRLLLIWGDPELSGEIQYKEVFFCCFLGFFTFQKQTEVIQTGMLMWQSNKQWERPPGISAGKPTHSEFTKVI
jgi:hypothetical protein